MRWLSLLTVLFCAFVAPVAPAAPPTKGWALMWNDEFDGTALDTTKWGHWLTGARRDAVNTPQAVSVDGGTCTIFTYTSGGTHYTGMISTEGKFTPAYGYIEARIDFDSSPGMWSAFWLQSPTMGNPIGNPQAAGTEIDVCEHRFTDGSSTIDGRIVGNIHWDGYGASHRSTGYQSPDLGLESGFHVYGMEWTPTQQRFYIDGVLRWTVTDSSNSPVSQRGEFLILSSEVEAPSWAGAIPAGGYGSLATTTTKMKIDYVRAYRRSEAVQNPDFEAQVAPWSQINQASLASTDGRGGTQGLRLNPNTTAGSATEQVLRGLLPATDYILTGWANPAATTWAPIRIGVKNHGAAQVYQAIGTNGYSEAAVPFTTGATNTTAVAFASQPVQWGDGFVDDFALYRAGTVMNGDLEHGRLSPNWTWFGGTTAATDASFAGDYALKFPAGSTAAGSEQEILGLTPGTAYRLTGWTTNGGQGVTFGVKNHGAAQVLTTVNATTWTRGTVNFTTGSASTSATIFASRASNAAASYADAFFLHQPFVAPWANTDVSALTLDGVAGTLGDHFVLQGSGADIWGTADSFHFAYRSMTGDGQITARVLGLTDTHAAAKTGVMMRETTANSARSVTVNWTPSESVEFIRRTTASGTSTATTIADVPASVWVRLARRGNVFASYYSRDGASWTRIGVVTIPMPATITAGIPVCSHDVTQFAEAVLDSVSLVAPPPDVLITMPVDGVTLGGATQRVRVTAAITDSGALGAPVIAWSKVSGPGTVTFANAASADTMATFSSAGIYVLRCTATTSAGTNHDDVTVNVSPAPDPALVLWLKLNESTGALAVDSSGGGNDATANGALVWQPAGGVAGGAAEFNGTDAYLLAADDPSLDGTGAFTLAYWFRVNTINGAGLVSKRNTFTDNNAYSTFLQTDGLLNVDIVSNNERFTSITVFDPGVWYHVAVVFDGAQAAASRAKLYVNGVLDKTATETSTSVPNYNSAFRVGAIGVGATTFLDGMVDDVRFYRRALSATEIAAVTAGVSKFAPIAIPGPVPAATNSIAATLAGSVVNDGGGTLTTAWTEVSGPGTPAFGNAVAPATTVTFNQPGTTVLRLTATNGNGQTSSDLSIPVAANPNIFADWQSLAWPGVTDANVIGPTADPERDGFRNLLEFALGLSATTPSRTQFAVAQAGAVWTFTYQRPPNRTGITYAVEVTPTLSPAAWTTAGVTHTRIATGDPETWQASVSPTPGGRIYFRLKITQP